MDERSRDEFQERLRRQFREEDVDEVLADYASNFAVNVRDLAQEQGLSYRELAVRAGISERSLYNHLRMHTSPTLRSIVILAIEFEVAPYDLLLPPDELRKRKYSRW